MRNNLLRRYNRAQAALVAISLSMIGGCGPRGDRTMEAFLSDLAHNVVAALLLAVPFSLSGAVWFLYLAGDNMPLVVSVLSAT